MLLRSGRTKSSLPPPVRRRLPVLRHRGGVRFSHTRAGDLYQQVEVDIGRELLPVFTELPVSLHRIPGNLPELPTPPLDEGAYPLLEAPLWSGNVESSDALLVQAAVKHGNRALRLFRRGARRNSAVKIVLGDMT